MKKIVFSLLLLISINIYAQNDEDRWVDSVYNTLTLEQRVGQLFNLRANDPNKEFNDYIDDYIERYNVGGVTFFRTDAEKLLKQANEWQSKAQTPMMIAIDGEWGIGMRINDGISYPYQMTLGAITNDSLIAEMGRQIAEQCARLGINVNFAPTVDVNNEPDNPVIGFRSFGEDPDNVAHKGLAYALALQTNAVLPSMKHFPGHGNTVTDSHYGLPVVKNSLEEINEVELVPFKYLIDNGVKGAMVGHLYFPALEPVANQSSSLSKIMVTDLLKTDLNYDGLIFTDGLEMKGAYNGMDPDSVCLQAIMAGNDVLLLPLDFEPSMQIIVDAANNNEAVNDRVEESCKKILRYKYRLGLNNYKEQRTENLQNDLHKNRYYALKQRLYNESVTMLVNKKGILPLNPDSDKNIAVVTFGKDKSISKKLSKKGIDNNAFLINVNASDEEIKRTAKQMRSYDYVILNIRNTSNYPSRNYGITASMVDFVKKVPNSTKLIINIFGNPYAVDKFSFGRNTAALLVGYEDNEMVENAIIDVIVGNRSPKGKLPVSLNKFKCGYGLEFNGFLTPETLPVSLIDNKYVHQIDSLILDAIEQKVFPGCQVLALKEGKIIYDKNYGKYTYEGESPVHYDAVYDIASLTKVFASTFAMMKLYDDGKIDLNSTLGDYFPFMNQSDKGDIKLIELLTHQSGFTPWIPIYKYVESSYLRECIDEEHTVRVARNLYLSDDFKYQIFDTIMNSELKEKKYKYSDIGFYFIPSIVESITNQSFETFLEENFYDPLNLNHICFTPLNDIDITNIVPTENDNYFRNQLIHGDVHDQTAALFGGVSGHAGLFSNARDLAVMMQLLLNGGYANGTQFISEETINYFTSAPFADNENRRGIGFDKPDLDPDAKYYTPSKQSSMSSFGHAGFTGTFAWADPENQLVVIFLSNRVYPTSDNDKISKLNIRTKIHDLFYKAVAD
ncbi:MAG: serine hydrolase [Lentimicrobiaceae bacterium]|nr:serine hydrolase [Lentimicrobiaceae bacterium]